MPPPPLLTRVKLRHLSVLLEVARTGSAREAAKALFVTESAISKTLKELEAELELQLFERSRHGMRLTEAGQRFTSHASHALAALQVGVVSAREVSGLGPVALRIGAMPVVAAVLLPQVLRRLAHEIKGLIVEVVTGSKGTLLERLHKDQIEFVLGRLPPPADMAGLSFEQLFLDRYIFAARPDHPLAGRPDITIKDLTNFVLVMPARETVTWQEIERLFIAQGALLNADRIETISLHLSRRYTLTSSAVWATSARLAQLDLESGVLVQLEVDTTMLEAPLGIIAKPVATPNAHRRLLLDLIRESSAELVASS